MDRLVPFASAFVKKENLKPAIILLYATLALSLWKYLPDVGRLATTEGIRLPEANLAPTLWDFLNGARNLFAAFLLMCVGPLLIIRFVFRENLADYGLQIGIKVRTIRSILFMVPLMAVLGWLSAGNTLFYRLYPCNPFAAASMGYFIAHSILYTFFFYLSWEFMFRGFMLRGLESSCGLTNAILIQTLASTMLHYGTSPGIEVLGSIGGGILWAFFMLRTRSILSGIVQHATLGIFLDIFLIMNLKSVV